MDSADLPVPEDPEGANGHTNGREAHPASPVPTTTPLQASDQHSATQGVPAEAQLLPSVVEPEPEVRPTVPVHPDAPIADAAAIAEYGYTWDVEGKHWRRSDGARICGAHPLSPKGPCRQSRLYDNGRCHYHGGPTPRGLASPSYKHGRWTKALNPKRSKAYAAARDDPALLDLRRTIGQLDTGVTEAMERREKLDTPNFRKDAIALFEQAQSEMQTDLQAATVSMTALGKLLRRGVREDDANEEIARHVSRMSKHMETAWKIRLAAGHAINESDLRTIIYAIIGVAEREIPKEHVGAFIAGLDRDVLRGRLALAGVDTTLR